MRIPAGVKDGSRVRAAGEGESGANGGPNGDLYLRVQTRPHPVFERKGDDLHTTVALPVTSAVLGGEAQVPTITGSVRLKIPETTQSGQVFRLKGHGMPIVGKPDDARRSVRHSRRATPPLADQGAAGALRGASEAREIGRAVMMLSDGNSVGLSSACGPSAAQSRGARALGGPSALRNRRPERIK